MGSGASAQVSTPLTEMEVNVFARLQEEYEMLLEEKVPDVSIFERMKQICFEADVNGDCPSSAKNTKIKGPLITRQATGQERGNKKKRTNLFTKGFDASDRDRIDVVDITNKNAKSDECMDLLRHAIRTVLFEDSGDHEMDLVLSVMNKQEVSSKDIVITQGDSGDKFYVVETGQLEFWVNDQVVGQVEAGGHFGELALIYDAPRAASVKAVTKSTLWTLERDDFRRIQAQTSSDSLAKRSKWLRNVPILETLSARQLSLLASSLQGVLFENKDIIIKQGDLGDAFYIVEEGGVSIETGVGRTISSGRLGSELALLTKGEYFGETALLNDQPRNATIHAVGSVKCLRLERSDFNAMLGPLASILDQNASIRILKMLDPFQGYQDEDFVDLLQRFETVTFLEGETIFTEETPAQAFYIVKDGNVKLKEIVAGKKDEIFFYLSTNDYFGIEMFDPSLATYQSRVVARNGNVKCICLTRIAFQDHLDRLPKVGNARLASLEDRDFDEDLSNVPLEELIRVGTLGEGSFGIVTMVRVFWNEKEHYLALKTMSKAHIINCQLERHIMREKEMLQSLPFHPFLIKLYATYQDSNFLYLLLELVQGGELFGLFHDEEKKNLLGESGIRFYAANIYLALEHLHKRDVAYRDLKPENLLIDTEGYLKMIDLGFAKKIPFTIMDRNGVEETHSRSYTLCGTQEYLAPEFILNTGHDLAVDYWALGVLIYEMLFGYTPFEADDGDTAKLFKNIAFVRTGSNKVRFPTDFEEKSPEVCDFISKLLHGDPSKRLGVGAKGSQEVREHVWFASIDWEAMVNKELDPPYHPKLSGKCDLSFFEGDQGMRAKDDALERFDTGDAFAGF